MFGHRQVIIALGHWAYNKMEKIKLINKMPRMRCIKLNSLFYNGLNRTKCIEKDANNEM